MRSLPSWSSCVDRTYDYGTGLSGPPEVPVLTMLDRYIEGARTYAYSGISMSSVPSSSPNPVVRSRFAQLDASDCESGQDNDGDEYYERKRTPVRGAASAWNGSTIPCAAFADV